MLYKELRNTAKLKTFNNFINLAFYEQFTPLSLSRSLSLSLTLLVYLHTPPPPHTNTHIWIDRQTNRQIDIRFGLCGLCSLPGY